MAANFQQHMGGPGQMMQQRQQQQQQQQQQQRQPQGQNNASGQIQQLIFNTLNSQTGPLSGWQAGVLINERIGLIFNIIGNLRLASQNQPNPPNLNKMIDIGIRFEKEIFEKSPNKEQYKHEVQLKLEQLMERRNQNQANMQQSINQQAQAQAQAQQQAQAQAQQMLMNQNNMPGQMTRPTQQSAQQGFQHLQHQMQASPIPGQQSQQQAPMGLPQQALPPNMTPNQQQQFQMSMQQTQQPQGQQNVPGRQPNGQQQMSAQDNALVLDLTTRLMAQATDEDKNSLRTNLQARMDPQQFQRYQAQGIDPLFLYYRNQAMYRLRQEKQTRMAQQLAQQTNIPGGAPMQQQRSMNPSPLNGQPQPPTSMAGNPDFGSFMGNMENLAAQQQQQGVMAQEAGQMVVPASGAPRNGTPQPGVMPGLPMNVNDQRGGANPNTRAQQQQQMLNAQQVQQQRLQHAVQQQQQQSQVQARLNAQAKAQQIGLLGQPGGMGPGPMPPQQSPAMGTLNTPLRTPSQQMNHPEPSQVNANTQFGQPLNPRFMQPNQRPQGQPNNFNAANAMFAAMGPEQQRQLATLTPDKFSEVVNKWHEQAQMNGGNMQAGRAQMPMQANGQVRPGPQAPQPGQLNPQNGANQFTIGNPGQRTPQTMAPGMNPQQQLLLQQQMNAMRPQMQQRAVPPNMGPNEQRNVAQMDAFDVPPAFRNHPTMPQALPPELKKWGQLKQWVAQNPSLGPDSLEGMKNLQRLHYQQMLRSRSMVQGQPGAMQPGVPGGQIGPPTAPPATSVASMGQHPIMQNGMSVPVLGQIRQPTPQEITNIRNHPSGKMAQASDDQIRALLMRNQVQGHNQMTPQQAQQQQQQQQRAFMQMQMQQRMTQQNGQQPHQPGQSQPNANSMPAAQVMQVQMPQQKQPQSGHEPPNPAAAATNASRSNRTQQAGRNQGQNSSPAQTSKNLKRANSDDIVEIPNPNSQQPRQGPQQTQGPKQSNQQTRANLKPEQVAALDPEHRKKYEAMIRAQANMANQASQTSNQANANRAPLNPEQNAKFTAIAREELERSKEPLPDIPMDPETKATTEELLKAIVVPLTNVARVVPRWFLVTNDEVRTRAFYRARYRLGKQFRDVQMTQLKDTFSITPKEVETTRQMLNGMVADLSARFPNMKKPEAAKSQASSTVAPQPDPQTSQAVQPPSIPTPLNAANLLQQQQQLSKLHQRSNSRSSHTPAAPTSTQPPFQIGATSPHGAPSYIGKSAVTQDNLQLPPARKKQKQGPLPGQGTPGSTSSPKVTKAVSPDVKRQAAESKSQPKPSLCCSEPECERHTVGFDSEDDLKHHTQEEHIRPLENPLKYAKETLASTLGLDSDGQSKKVVISTSQDSAKIVANDSKQGQTPNVKSEATPAAGTPMNRQASMNRQGSAAGARPNMQSKSGLTKEPTAKLQAVPKDSSKQQENQAPQETVVMDPWANATIDPHDLMQSFQPFETGANGAISDINVYRSITPNDTPESSKDGVSEPNSDISEGVGLDFSIEIFDDRWVPFGPNETDGLFDLNSFDVNNGDDLIMFDDDQPVVNLQSWDDMVDASTFDKPFSFDTSLYSMQAE